MFHLRALSPRVIDAALLLAFAVGLRWPWFGDPIAGLDEQFYLLITHPVRLYGTPRIDAQIWVAR